MAIFIPCFAMQRKLPPTLKHNNQNLEQQRTRIHSYLPSIINGQSTESSKSNNELKSRVTLRNSFVRIGKVKEWSLHRTTRTPFYRHASKILSNIKKSPWPRHNSKTLQQTIAKANSLGTLSTFPGWFKSCKFKRFILSRCLQKIPISTHNRNGSHLHRKWNFPVLRWLS